MPTGCVSRRATSQGPSERLRAMLDAEQLAAVEGARGRVLVLASAGSGKTRTIVATLAHLVETGTPPEAIMLVTFTRRAAREMIERAEGMAGVDLASVTAGTFHAVCRRILARYGPLVGLPSSFTVLDAEDQAQLAAIARDALLAGRETRRPPKPATIVGLASLAAESGRGLESRPRAPTRALATGSRTCGRSPTATPSASARWRRSTTPTCWC